MRPSSLGGGRILRRSLSVCLSVCPMSRYRTFRHALRAAYRTAISAAQILVYETRCTYFSFVRLAGNDDTLQLTLVSSQNSLSHCTTADQLISRLF